MVNSALTLEQICHAVAIVNIVEEQVVVALDGRERETSSEVTIAVPSWGAIKYGGKEIVCAAAFVEGRREQVGL